MRAYNHVGQGRTESPSAVVVAFARHTPHDSARAREPKSRSYRSTISFARVARVTMVYTVVTKGEDVLQGLKGVTRGCNVVWVIKSCKG